VAAAKFDLNYIGLDGRGATLLHFSPQPGPFSFNTTPHRVPHRVLVSSRKVDEHKPLPEPPAGKSPTTREYTLPLLSST
jgi:hypothetical protein